MLLLLLLLLFSVVAIDKVTVIRWSLTLHHFVFKQLRCNH